MFMYMWDTDTVNFRGMLAWCFTIPSGSPHCRPTFSSLTERRLIQSRITITIFYSTCNEVMWPDLVISKVKENICSKEIDNKKGKKIWHPNSSTTKMIAFTMGSQVYLFFILKARPEASEPLKVTSVLSLVEHIFSRCYIQTWNKWIYLLNYFLQLSLGFIKDGKWTSGRMHLFSWACFEEICFLSQYIRE